MVGQSSKKMIEFGSRCRRIKAVSDTSPVSLYAFCAFEQNTSTDVLRSAKRESTHHIPAGLGDKIGATK